MKIVFWFIRSPCQLLKTRKQRKIQIFKPGSNKLLMSYLMLKKRSFTRYKNDSNRFCIKPGPNTLLMFCLMRTWRSLKRYKDDYNRFWNGFAAIAIVIAKKQSSITVHTVNVPTQSAMSISSTLINECVLFVTNLLYQDDGVHHTQNFKNKC